MKDSRPRPTCNGCRSFVLTYNRDWPYACRAFGIRSKRHPIIDVKANSGMDCQARAPRETPHRASRSRRAS